MIDTDQYNRIPREKKFPQVLIGAALCVSLLIASGGCGGGEAVLTKSDHDAQDMALGVVDRSIFTQPQYHEFQARYDTVATVTEFVQMVHQLHHDVDILVFFGTWCGDSKREIPRFMKVVDEAGIERDRITLYGLNRSKKSPDGLTEAFKIEFIPTFIFRKNGKEIGRITESPKTTLEEDMAHILLGGEFER
jgi:thiol-disulfide isomerase/thioredoxin